MIKFTYDSRDKIFQNKFGAVLDLPEEFNVDSSLHDDVQPIGDVKCTCYTACDIAEDQTKTVFDINDLWKRIPQSPQGANPRDVFKEVIANGLLPKGKAEREKRWSSYWRGDLGSHDPFDNLRSALVTANSPVGIGTYWYLEWLNKTILPVGKTGSFGHMYVCEGWKLIDGQPHLIIEAWTGRKMYMSREVFNTALKPLGMQTWVLSTSEIDSKRSKSLIEMIKDVMTNLIITLRTKIKTFNVEPVVPEPPVETVSVKTGSMLESFCTAIRNFEGYYAPGENPKFPNGSLSWRNRNPGNCRYSPVGYDPKYGLVKRDSNNFAIFKDHETGWLYLNNFVRAKAKQFPHYTIFDYISKIHAPSSDGNDPLRYATWVAERVGVSVAYKLIDLTK